MGFAQAAEIREIRWGGQVISVYELLEIDFNADGIWVNPFDPDQVVINLMVMQPSGIQIQLPAFYYQDYQEDMVEGEQRLSPLGEGHWKVRFVPLETGRHRLKLVARDRSGAAYSPEVALECLPARRSGYLRVIPGAVPRFYLEPDQSFVAIGQSLCGVYSWNMDLWESMYRSLHDSHANFVRVWMGPFNGLALEMGGWEACRSPGEYDLAAAWRLDHVLRQGLDLGILHMLVLDSFHSLRKMDPESGWTFQAYATENGGFLENPSDFFTHPEARRLYRNRLRYIVARWSAFPSLGVWELWNEVDRVEGFDVEKVQAWHKEMARYLRRLDVYRHPITTSFHRWEGVREIDSLEEIEILQTHVDGCSNIHQFFKDRSVEKRGTYPGKPHWVTEFGIGFPTENPLGMDSWKVDSDGRGLREGLWAGLFCGDAAAGLIRYGANQVDRLDLYKSYRAFFGFMAGIEFHKETWRFADARCSWLGDSPVQKGKSQSDSKDQLPVPVFRLLASRERILGWTVLEQRNWFHRAQGIQVQGMGRIMVEIEGVMDGRWQIIWVDPASGQSLDSTGCLAAFGTLSFSSPPFEFDLAFRAEWMG